MGMTILADNGQTPPSMLLGYGNTPGSCTLELMPIKDPGPRPSDVPRLCPGIRHFAVLVSDFEKAYARMKEAGVPFLFDPVVAIGGGRIVSFRDPEGNEVQIVQR
jgi:glyoxylase I family protein